VKYKLSPGQMKKTLTAVPMRSASATRLDVSRSLLISKVRHHRGRRGRRHIVQRLAGHLAVFDRASKPSRPASIHYLAHLKMMAAAQSFISGAISKTVNMPNECTVEDIRDAYVQAWKMGLKCVAIYRDGSKRSQPLNTKRTNEAATRQRRHFTALAKNSGSEKLNPRPANRCRRL
jgi:ribonucleoside-diphosphate reductase alpha chain